MGGRVERLGLLGNATPGSGAVKSARGPADVAAQLRALETAMQWQSVEESWRGRRDGWVAEMQAARTSAAVARGLLELETGTNGRRSSPPGAGCATIGSTPAIVQ